MFVSGSRVRVISWVSCASRFQGNWPSPYLVTGMWSRVWPTRITWAWPAVTPWLRQDHVMPLCLSGSGAPDYRESCVPTALQVIIPSLVQSFVFILYALQLFDVTNCSPPVNRLIYCELSRSEFVDSYSLFILTRESRQVSRAKLFACSLLLLNLNPLTAAGT